MDREYERILAKAFADCVFEIRLDAKDCHRGGLQSLLASKGLGDRDFMI